MHSHAYTQCALTIIAIALCALVAQNAITSSKSQDRPLQKVQLCDAIDNCLQFSPVRKHASAGNFIYWTLPISVETDDPR
jgi:hypothetical protein